MKNYHKVLGLALVVLFMIPGNSLFVSATPAQDEIPRDDVVWSCGYWASPNHWNPAFWGGEAWGALFMYLPMFDYNYETDSLIPMIGESMAWNADGSELSVKIWDDAEWSDGQPITSQDINWTFNYFYDMGQWGNAFTKRVDNFNIVDDKNFILEMNANYSFSQDIWNRFIGQYKPLPQHTWDAIETDISGFPVNSSNLWDLGNWAFMNDWLADDFPAAWKVCSGPYAPYFVSETKDKEIYKKYDSWWGDGVLTDGFADMPTYIGHLRYATNFAMNSAFADNQIDWYGGYYPRIWELMADNEYVHTWVDENPYFLPISGMIQLVPNQRRYPFDQLWFRQALAYAINYDDLSKVSASGYLEKARVGWIDDRSPTQDQFYDPTVESTYAYDFDPAAARAKLDEYCYEKDGVWYTDNSDAYAGKLGAFGDPVADDDPSTDHVNVALGGYDIIVPYGWSDSMMQTTLLSNYFADIGIQTNPSYVEYNTYLDLGVQNGGADFDLMHFVMGFAPANTLYAGMGTFVGAANNWANYTAWENQDFLDDFEALEVAAPGSTEEMNLAKDMQEILATTLPAVPIAPNGYWYGFNNKYWAGWPTEANPFVQATAPWETAHSGVMLSMLMQLHPSTGDENNSDDTGNGGTVPGYPIGIVSVAAIAVVSVLLYRKRK